MAVQTIQRFARGVGRPSILDVVREARRRKSLEAGTLESQLGGGDDGFGDWSGSRGEIQFFCT